MKIPKRENGERLAHTLKSDPDNYIAVIRDEKLAEIRLNDREYEVGDYIMLRQTAWTGDEMAHKKKPLTYTGRVSFLKIIHIHFGVGMGRDYVALSIRRLD